MVTLLNVLTLMTAPIFMMVCGQNPSVSFIESKKFNFFMAKGKIVQDQWTEHFLTNDNMNNCACKSACIAVDCAAWSLTHMVNGTVLCRLDKEGPYDDPPIEDNQHDSTYFYRQDKIPGTYFSMGDGLLYVEFDVFLEHDDGIKKCENLPGHRLMIIKTSAQWNALKLRASYGLFYALDLEKKMENNNVENFWGDGTNYKDTQLLGENAMYVSSGMYENVYAYYNGYIHDISSDYSVRIVICQANPFAVDW